MHTNPCTCLAYDELGRIYSGGYDCNVIAFDKDARTVRWMTRHEGLVNAVDVGRRLLLSAGADRVARIWNRETGESAGPPLGPRPDDINVAFLSVDEARIVVGGDEGRLSCYDVASGTLLWERYCAPPQRYGESIEAAARLRRAGGRDLYFAADNSGRFIVCDEEGNIHESGELAAEALTEGGDIECAASDPKRQQFLLGTACGYVVGLPLDRTAQKWSARVHGSAVKALAVSGDRLVCTSYDNKIFTIDLTVQGKTASTHLAGSGRRGWSRKLAVDPTTTGRVACTSLGVAPQIWDVQDLNLAIDDAPPTRGINAVAVLQSRVIVGCDSGELWTTTDASKSLLCDIGSMVLGLTARPNGFLLGAATHDGCFTVVEVGTGRVIARSRLPGDPAVCCAVSPDGRISAVGHYSGTIRLLDAASLNLIATLRCTDTVKSVAFVSNERLVAGIANGSLELWDMKAAERLRRQSGLFLVNSVHYAPATHKLYSVGRDCLLREWNTNLEMLAAWSRHSRSIKVVAVSANGKWICTSGYDAMVGFQSADGVYREFAGHQHPGVPALHWLDSDHVVSGGWDGSVRIWSPTAGEVARTSVA
jgi:WD40 repeat protein